MSNIEEMPDFTANWTDADWQSSQELIQSCTQQDLERLPSFDTSMQYDQPTTTQFGTLLNAVQDSQPDGESELGYSDPAHPQLDFLTLQQGSTTASQSNYGFHGSQADWPAATSSTIPTCDPFLHTGIAAPGTIRNESSVSLSVQFQSHPQYQQLCPDFASAHDLLAFSGEMVPLAVQQDDWYALKFYQLHACAARLFEALGVAPTITPSGIVLDYQKEYYRKHQETQLRSIEADIKANPLKAEARVLLLIEELLNLHELGCPAAAAAHKPLKDGYRLEDGLTASARMELIIKAAAADKYLATDILAGTNIPDIVRSPAAYLRRKNDNCKVNAKKAMDRAEADRAKAVNCGREGPNTKKPKTEQKRKRRTPGCAEHPTPAASTPTATPFNPLTPPNLPQSAVDQHTPAQLSDVMYNPEQFFDFGNATDSR